MSGKIGLLILHGIGTQKPGYSHQLTRTLNQRLSQKGVDSSQVKYEEVLYSDLFDVNAEKRSEYLINASPAYQVVSRSLRKLLIYVLSDAVSYRANYKAVHQRISDHIDQLQNQLSQNTPVVIAAHSMGALAISDYLYDLQQNLYPQLPLSPIHNLKALITFGCNIPLFEMGQLRPVSFQRPESDHDHTFFWKNLYSPFDILSYKIAEYYTQPIHQPFPLSDSCIYAGGPFTRWNIGSHAGYWTHKQLHRVLMDTLIPHLEKGKV